VIVDPELAGASALGSAAPTAAAVASASASGYPRSELRAVLRSRLGVDSRWQDAREEVLEATQLALLEARVRTTEDVAFAVGLRLRHFTGLRAKATPEADAARYTLDAAPTAGYADLTLDDAAALHLRLGWQSVALGRFDALEPSKVLTASDLRSGPTTLPEAAELAQPALRLDWEAASFLSLRALALPFFTPDLVYGYTGDYALAPQDSDTYDALIAALAPSAADAQRLERALRRGLSRSGQGVLAESALSAFVPAPSLAHPQGALRVLAHGPRGELGLTLATALERLPAVVPSAALLDYLDDPSPATSMALDADEEPLAVRYGRLGMLALDAGTELGPIALGAELAYGLHRTLLAAPEAGLALPEASDVLYAGLRAEHVSGEHLVLTAELLGARALQSPEQRGARYLFLHDGRWLFAAAGFAAYRPGDLGLVLELGGGLLNGPTYLLAPRLEQELTDGLYAELGAHVVGGKRRAAGSAGGVTLGGLYDDVDQLFAGLRWVP